MLNYETEKKSCFLEEINHDLKAQWVRILKICFVLHTIEPHLNTHSWWALYLTNNYANSKFFLFSWKGLGVLLFLFTWWELGLMTKNLILCQILNSWLSDHQNNAFFIHVIPSWKSAERSSAKIQNIKKKKKAETFDRKNLFKWLGWWCLIQW